MEPQVQDAEEDVPLPVEIAGTEQIVDIIDALDGVTYALSVGLDGAAADLPATVLEVDPERRTMSLALLESEALGESALAESHLTLHAESESNILHSATVDTLEVSRASDYLEVRCTLPRTLYTTPKRRHVRVPFIRGMRARVHVSVFDDHPPVPARLRNLSLGGCLLEVPLNESPLFRVGESVSEVAIVFPNGERFSSEAVVRHVTPAGRSHHARVGLSFDNPLPDKQQRLMRFVTEAEREAAYRSRRKGPMVGASSLFVGAYASSLPEDGQGQYVRRGPRGAEPSPLAREVGDVARQLHIILLSLRSRRPPMVDTLGECADTLLRLLERQRQALFYAIGCLDHEPQWVQHSLNVAAKLGDLMLAEPQHAPHARQAVAAALLHDMGKGMLLGEEFTTLEGEFDERQRSVLRSHVERLVERLGQTGWPEEIVDHDVISSINERLDGSGYPRGRRGPELSPVARMAAIVDVVDAMTRPRGDRVAMTALKAYRYLYRRPECFDRRWVVRYVQRHGVYPIGSLVRYSNGFLAWVMALDERGLPTRVRVVRNLAHPDLAMDAVLDRVDFAQLGSIEGLVSPEAYRLRPL